MEIRGEVKYLYNHLSDMASDQRVYVGTNILDDKHNVIGKITNVDDEYWYGEIDGNNYTFYTSEASMELAVANQEAINLEANREKKGVFN